jgi:hypothetical protein
MPSNIIVKEKSVKTILGQDNGQIVFDKIMVETDSLKKISDKRVKELTYTISNYIETVCDSDYSILQHKTIKEIEDLWGSWVHEFKSSYNTKNHNETNKILLDRRVDGIGFYWVDLEKEFCIESLIRMDDCGRVNYGDTTIELREQTETENLSWVIIVYDTVKKNIRQIKGKNNQKPDIIYWPHISDFLLNTDYTINGYIPQFKSENDLKMTDFNVEIRNQIRNKHQNLFIINSII